MPLRALAMLIAAMLPAAPLHAAYISELVLGGPVPNAVEITGESGSPGAFELAILDASETRAGDVLALIELEFEPVSSVTLFTAAPWPAGFLTHHAPVTPTRRSLPGLLAPLAPATAEARTLMLLAPGSGLDTGRTNLFRDPGQAQRFADATVLDVVTLAPDARAVGYAGERAVDPALGWAISRPIAGPGLGPADHLLVGDADEQGRLPGLPKPYRITPGWANQAYIPEPGTAAALLLAAALLPHRRWRSAAAARL